MQLTGLSFTSRHQQAAYELPYAALAHLTKLRVLDASACDVGATEGDKKPERQDLPWLLVCTKSSITA